MDKIGHPNPIARKSQVGQKMNNKAASTSLDERTLRARRMSSGVVNYNDHSLPGKSRSAHEELPS